MFKDLKLIRIKPFFACLLFLALFQVEAFAVESASKIGIVNPGNIINKYPPAQKVFSSLEKEEKALQDKIEAQREAILKARSQKKSSTEIQMLVEKFRQEVEPQARALEKKTKEENSNLETKVKDAIKKVAAKSGVDLVLLEQAVLWPSDGNLKGGVINLDDEVLKALPSK